MPQALQRYAAVSLFSGCGGMDLGAEQTGRAQVVWAIDNEHWAVETYKRNLGHHIVESDITQVDVPGVPCDILLAGPPCQDYSTLWNHDGLKTARGNLFRQVARFLSELLPVSWKMCQGFCPPTAAQPGRWSGMPSDTRQASRVAAMGRRFAMTSALKWSTWQIWAYRNIGSD